MPDSFPQDKRLEELRRLLEDKEREHHEEERPNSASSLKSRATSADEAEKARGIALRSLEQAPRTKHQLRTKLRDKGISEATVEQVISRYEEVGLLDDRSFAYSWVRSRASQRGVAALAIRGELSRKGIEQGLIEEALRELLPPEFEANIGEELAASKAREQLRKLGPDALRTSSELRQKALQRIVGALARKGHPPSSSYAWAKNALDDALSEES